MIKFCHYSLLLHFYFIIMAQMFFFCKVIIIYAKKYSIACSKTSQVHFGQYNDMWCTSFDRQYHFGNLHSRPKLAIFNYLSIISHLMLPHCIPYWHNCLFTVQVLIFCTSSWHFVICVNVTYVEKLFFFSDSIITQPMTIGEGPLIFLNTIVCLYSSFQKTTTT